MAKIKKDKKSIAFKIFSYDLTTLEEETRKIVRRAQELGLKFSGPIPLQRKIQKATVIRSPHVYKSSREQFERRIYRRLIEFFESPEKIMNSYKQPSSLPASVWFKLKF